MATAPQPPREIPADTAARLERLHEILRELSSVLVAFSGGVDSTFLLAEARATLGRAHVLAVTAHSPIYHAAELAEARCLAETLDVEHLVVENPALKSHVFRANPPDRCYHCKRELLAGLAKLAAARGLAAVLLGDQADDSGDFRPGARAALEAGARAPLREAGLTKREIRELSRRLKLPTAEKPSAACLASRIPYGEPIDEAKLAAIAAAEEFLHRLGYRQVRVRHHGRIARLEVEPERIARLATTDRAAVTTRLRELGFTYVALDLEGYRTGSLNEVLVVPPPVPPASPAAPAPAPPEGSGR